jgi:hypothetical protein
VLDHWQEVPEQVDKKCLSSAEPPPLLRVIFLAGIGTTLACNARCHESTLRRRGEAECRFYVAAGVAGMESQETDTAVVAFVWPDEQQRVDKLFAKSSAWRPAYPRACAPRALFHASCEPLRHDWISSPDLCSTLALRTQRFAAREFPFRHQPDEICKGAESHSRARLTACR